MQGAITKRMTAIEEMAGMDVLCSDKTGTLTLNKLTVDKNMIEVTPFFMKKIFYLNSFGLETHLLCMLQLHISEICVLIIKIN